MATTGDLPDIIAMLPIFHKIVIEYAVDVKDVEENIGKFSLEVVFGLVGEIRWSKISYVNCSIVFFRQFRDHIHWGRATETHVMSPEFMMEFRDRIDWHIASYVQNIPENIITANYDSVDWEVLSTRDNWSPHFHRKYYFDLYAHKNSYHSPIW